MFPPAPDQPLTPSIAFSAQCNPWTVGAAYTEGLANSIYSNAAWEVQSEPSWLTATNGTTLLTPDLFEQGGVTVTAGLTWEAGKIPSSKRIRLKKPYTDLNNEVYSLISGVPGYMCDFVYLDSNGIITGNSSWISINGRVDTGARQQVGILIRKTDDTAITPADITTLNARWGKRYHQFPAGSYNLTTLVAANTGEARTGNIVLKSLAGSATYSVAVTQAGVSGNISVDTPTLNVDYLTHPVTVDVTSIGSWSVSQRDTWITPDLTEGAPGETTVMLTIGDNTSNAARTGTITFYNDQPEERAVVTVNQTGAPTSISVTPSRVSGPKAGGSYIVPAVVVSENIWTVASAPSWVFITPTSGEAGQTAMGVRYDTANPGAARTGLLRIENTTTHEIAICLITQEG